MFKEEDSGAGAGVYLTNLLMEFELSTSIGTQDNRWNCFDYH